MYVSGDTNGNDELDLTETWLYEATGEAIACQYNNLGTAKGTPPVGDDVDATDDDADSPDTGHPHDQYTERCECSQLSN